MKKSVFLRMLFLPFLAISISCEDIDDAAFECEGEADCMSELETQGNYSYNDNFDEQCMIDAAAPHKVAAGSGFLACCGVAAYADAFTYVIPILKAADCVVAGTFCAFVGDRIQSSVQVSQCKVHGSKKKKKKPQATNVKVDAPPRSQGQKCPCFSAKNCSGKVIGRYNHVHQCKNRGNSFLLADGTCLSGTKGNSPTVMKSQACGYAGRHLEEVDDKLGQIRYVRPSYSSKSLCEEGGESCEECRNTLYNKKWYPKCINNYSVKTGKNKCGKCYRN